MVPPDRRPRLSLLAACTLTILVSAAAPARAEPFGWPQVQGPGSSIVLTYSFVNLFDPAFQGIAPERLRAATAQAFSLWSQYAPLNFVERPDSGPPSSDADYAPTGLPQIRIGAHDVDDESLLAHTFLPVSIDVSGLAGDIHFNSDSAVIWGVEDGSPAIDFLEVMVHEIGHALGLQHILDADAIMNPFHAFRFTRGQPSFLLPADIAAIQAIYGEGVGSVAPMPEPSTLTLAFVGLAALLARRRRSITSAR